MTALFRSRFQAIRVVFNQKNIPPFPGFVCCTAVRVTSVALNHFDNRTSGSDVKLGKFSLAGQAPYQHIRNPILSFFFFFFQLFVTGRHMYVYIVYMHKNDWLRYYTSSRLYSPRLIVDNWSVINPLHSQLERRNTRLVRLFYTRYKLISYEYLQCNVHFTIYNQHVICQPVECKNAAGKKTAINYIRTRQYCNHYDLGSYLFIFYNSVGCAWKTCCIQAYYIIIFLKKLYFIIFF